MVTNRIRLVLAAAALCSVWTTRAPAGQPLETETARPLPAGWLKIESTFEYQTSPDGKEYDLPFAFEYGLTDRLELLLEPVFFTAIRPSSGRSATGIGDLEITLSYLLLEEHPLLPALAPAVELKIPTANDKLISTEQADYRFLLIASKRVGPFDTHLNLGYTVLGSPPGTQLGDVFDYAFAVEYSLNSSVDLVAEVLGNTSATSESNTGEGTGAEPQNATVPEAPGNELSGLVGVRYHLDPSLFLSLGLSYDNNNALLIRPGVTYEFNVYGMTRFPW